MKKSKSVMLKSAISTATVLLSFHANVALAKAPADNRGPVSLNLSEESQETDRFIVRYRDNSKSRKSAEAADLAKARIHGAAKARGLTAKQLRINGLGAQIWVLDKHMKNVDVQAMARAIAAVDPDVEYAEPDRLMHSTTIPNDPEFGVQWNMQNTAVGINTPGAWAYGITGAGKVVGVLDTGYLTHFDLTDNTLPGYDFVDRDSDARDLGGSNCTTTNWHGSHVAGIIAGVGNNGVGFAGVAYGAKILPLRVLGCNGGYESDIADGMMWGAGISFPWFPANPTPAHVLNLSLGRRDSCSNTYASAVNAARSRGVVVVASAGNNASNVVQFTPANCPGVVSVAATDESGLLASFSNYGAMVSLAAPGTNILSAGNTGTSSPGGDAYGTQSGTSQAAPHVAGVAALILQARPTLSGEAVEYILTSTTKPFPHGCYNCGSGIVDAQAAVATALNWTTRIIPRNIVQNGYGTGHISANAMVEPIGVGPFAYSWSTNGNFSLSNTTSKKVQISALVEVCGYNSTTTESGTLSVVVTDSQGTVTRDTINVEFNATGTSGDCM